MKISVLNLTLHHPIQDELPFADEWVVVGPLMVNLNVLAPKVVIDVLLKKLEELANTVHFSITDQVYVFLEPGQNCVLASLFIAQAFWLLGKSPIIWILTGPGQYIDMSSMTMLATEWALKLMETSIKNQKETFQESK